MKTQKDIRNFLIGSKERLKELRDRGELEPNLTSLKVQIDILVWVLEEGEGNVPRHIFHDKCVKPFLTVTKRKGLLE